MKINFDLTAARLAPSLQRLFALSAEKIRLIEKSWDPRRGAPVFTAKGRYTTRGWTEWTQGFQFGSALLQFDATDEREFFRLGRQQTLEWMAPHLTHFGVHDHGFNNVSTYGNLLRLLHEGKAPCHDAEANLYALALKISGAVQAFRWTHTAEGTGFIYSFNGPHSLFIDTMRSLRALALSHLLGHYLAGEGDKKISLLERLWMHAATTAKFAIYYGDGRDTYDTHPGRTAHESIFNTNDGQYRCPNSQQGYSPFSTWTRGLAWAICGFAEELEFFEALAKLRDADWGPLGGKARVFRTLRKAATATADFYLANCASDGIPVWDTGAPGVAKLKGYHDRPADPFNGHEPIDSSAAAIAAQGLVRLGRYLLGNGSTQPGRTYFQAGLTITETLLNEPYLSASPKHQGLLLHSVYHRPNGWDYIPPGQQIPNGESSMWGDYHLRELGVMLWREARRERPLTFFGSIPATPPRALK